MIRVLIGFFCCCCFFYKAILYRDSYAWMFFITASYVYPQESDPDSDEQNEKAKEESESDSDDYNKEVVRDLRSWLNA